MNKRLDNAEKVKGAKAEQWQKFKLTDLVVIQNPLSKRWDLQGVITEVLSLQRYRVRTDTSQKYTRYRIYLRPSAQASLSQGRDAQAGQFSLPWRNQRTVPG